MSVLIQYICINNLVNFWAAYAYIKSQFDPPLYLEISNCQKSSNLTDQEYTQMSLSTFS